MEPAKKKKGRPPANKPAEQQAPSLKLTTEADHLLTVQSKKAKLSKREYASAAIAYFAESGLNPTAAQGETLASFSNRQKEEGRANRQQTVDVGNRLISIMRTWEKANYAFMQQLQAGTVNHMEQIESNLLQQLVGLESSYFVPLVEMIMKSNIETFFGRVIGEKMDLRGRGQKDSEWAEGHKRLNESRDKQLVEAMRDFIKDNRLEKPTLSPKPQALALPVRAPAAGAAPAAVPPAGGQAPK